MNTIAMMIKSKGVLQPPDTREIFILDFFAENKIVLSYSVLLFYFEKSVYGVTENWVNMNASLWYMWSVSFSLMKDDTF